MKRTLSAILFIINVLIYTAISSCTATRILVYNAPQADDHKYLDKIPLPPSTAPVHFARNVEQNMEIDSLMDETTCAFLVLQGDSICYSYYDYGCCDTTCLCMFSISKSFIGTLIGIAIDDSLINSAGDPIAAYLPCTAALIPDGISINELLDMRAGFHESGYTTARLYYCPDMTREIVHITGNRKRGDFHYSSMCTQLLSSLLEQASRQSAATYLADRLWEPLGMQKQGYVCIDSPKTDCIRSFYGICCTPMDALKLSVLYRDGGVFMDKRIVSEKWINSCINPTNMSNDKNGACYNHHWWVLVPGREFFAKGLLGQYLYVNRDTDTVIARFGVEKGGTDWIETFRIISENLGGKTKAGSENI